MVSDPLKDDEELQVLRHVHRQGAGSQRELAAALGISLGKSNYIVRALLGRGWMKVMRFKNSDNKGRYLYLVTPSGVAEKVRRTRAFVHASEERYLLLKQQLETLRAELDDDITQGQGQ
jgi:EPS-associated MarR family transcriptional regulator